MKIREYYLWLGKILRKPDLLDSVREISLFTGLSSFQLYQLNCYMHARSYKSGEVIFEQGYPLDAVFFITGGEVNVSGLLSGPAPTVLRKGDFIGIIDMFHEGIRSSSAKAGTDVTALAISKNDLSSLIERDKAMGIKILNAICRYLSGLNFADKV